MIVQRFTTNLSCRDRTKSSPQSDVVTGGQLCARSEQRGDMSLNAYAVFAGADTQGVVGGTCGHVIHFPPVSCGTWACLIDLQGCERPTYEG